MYRTAANLATLKLLATIANNTATTYGPDTASDASLGALPPTIDTSELTQPVGQVVPGATSIPTAGASPFLSTGGWVQSATQVIRYTGVTRERLDRHPGERARRDHQQHSVQRADRRRAGADRRHRDRARPPERGVRASVRAAGRHHGAGGAGAARAQSRRLADRRHPRVSDQRRAPRRSEPA